MLVNIERVLSDIKRGVPVIIQEKKSSLLFAASENLTIPTAKIFFDRPSRLVLSRFRANFICSPKPKHDISLAFNANVYSQLATILWERDIQQGYTLSYPYTPASSLEGLTLAYPIQAELLPSIVCSTTITKQDKNLYFSISASELDHYKDTYTKELHIACTTPIVLEGAKEAKIIAFKAAGSSKEHYALVIGDIDQKVPLVRVHSSCYTGDLLASMVCDCRDQLQSAIKQIAEYGSGIILYMMQEGRDIGLLNKLRAYKLKTSGLDTVDANHALGFESDLRTFEAASKMLELLGHKAIRLLTSNPKKASDLANLGITVTESIPHSTRIHEFNKDYIKTKIDRLGHSSKK